MVTVTQKQADWFAEAFTKIVNNVGQVLMGKEREIRLVLVALFSEGHVLVEDSPGTGKTVLAEAIAHSIDGPQTRVQFTPDLTPADIIGSTVFDQELGKFQFHAGPIFTSILLVERINRGSPRTQASLLEAMEERRVTVDGVSHALSETFFVIATQNPAGTAGVVPLEDEQLDRFLIKVSLGYPDNPTAVRLLMASGEPKRTASTIMGLNIPIGGAALAANVFLDPAIADYINSLVRATYDNPYVRVGVSMRGALGLARAAKTWAFSKSRTHVVPEDLRDVIGPVLAHRIVLSESAHEVGLTAEEIIDRILLDVDLPRWVDNTVLPRSISAAEVRELAETNEREVLLGLGSDPRAPQSINIETHPHLLLTGPSGSGRTTALRSYVSELQRIYGPDEIRIFVLEARDSGFAELPSEYLGTHAVGAEAARRTLRELAEFFEERLGGGEPADGVNRWDGREGFIVIDDIDLLLGPGAAALGAVAPLVKFGSHVGMHVIVASSESESGLVAVTLHELLSSGGAISLPLGPTPGRTQLEVKGSSINIQLVDQVETPRDRIGFADQTELVDLLGSPDVRDIEFDTAWSGRSEQDLLRVPIGQSADGTPIVLDLKDRSEHGLGPHGLIVGTSGSGMSELLRTVVLALTMTHSPQELNIAFVSPGGGAVLPGFEGVPHFAGMITNLAGENALIGRLHDVLNGELDRRRELLRASGNFASASDYERARQRGHSALPTLPALLIIVDEFSRLLDAHPELIETLVDIGRSGRRLKIHLLLSTDRLSGSARALQQHLSYRIALRSSSAEESRLVLGVEDASLLPFVPGLGILASGEETLTKFRAAYVSDPPKSRRASTRDLLADTDPKLESGYSFLSTEPEEQRSTWEIAVERMGGRGSARQLWLPLLDDSASLDVLMPDLSVDPKLGLISQRWRDAGVLTVPIGIVDVPLEHRREALTISLTGGAGHMVIVGSAMSGKSTLVRTTMAALSLTATPQELQFYVVDFGGGGYEAMADLPQLSAVANRSEPDSVKRLIAEVSRILDAREVYFREKDVDSIDTYRQRRTLGLVDDGYGDVFLVIDGWATFHEDYELEAEVQAITARSLAFGVHVLITAVRWTELRSSINELIGTRVELRLGQPSESEIDHHAAKNVPANAPGRGLSPRSLQMLTALPRLDGSGDADGLTLGLKELVRRIRTAWLGPDGPPQKSSPI